jgi:hypothetical protein
MTLATAVFNVGVKSIQAGTIAVSGVTSNTATISTVNTAKAFVIFNGFSTSTTGGDMGRAMVRVSLTNATTVTAEKSNSIGDSTVSYTVVEFY